MFKKTFFVAALAISGVTSFGVANAATIGEANSAIGAIAGCSGDACSTSISNALAVLGSVAPGPQRDAAASDLVAAIATASANNPSMNTQMASYAGASCNLIANPQAATVCSNIEVAIASGQPQTATAAVGDSTGGPGGYDGATRGDNANDFDAS